MRYAFTFDASACTGCKACQVACKDQHDLPLGVLWRRVYEVSGGGWERHGAAWTNTVFAYNMSVACNHCAEPACAAACPTGACTVRHDGIVWIDARRCAGCQYCAWACPYSAPKFLPDAGYMTKCDFCRDLVDEGRSPACVAACPMRALEFVALTSGESIAHDGRVALWDQPAVAHPYPLPAFSRTEPQIAVKLHAAMTNTLPKDIANREEIHPPDVRSARTIAGLHVEDLPLVLFTLFGQAAAGVAVISLLTGFLDAPRLATTGLLIALAACASLFHLGQISQAWRTAANGRTSALSREVVALGVFAVACVIAWIAGPAGHVAVGVSGLAFVYAMAEVYSIEGIAGWESTRTRVAFAASALLLGLIGLIAVLAAGRAFPPWSIATLAAALFIPLVLHRWRFYAAPRAKTM